MVIKIKDTSSLKNDVKSLDTRLIYKNVIPSDPIKGELLFNIALFSNTFFLYKSVKWETYSFINFISEKNLQYYKVIYDYLAKTQLENGFISTKLLWKTNDNRKKWNSEGNFGLEDVEIKHFLPETPSSSYKKERIKNILNDINSDILNEHCQKKSIFKIAFDSNVMKKEIFLKYNVNIPKDIFETLKLIIYTNNTFEDESFDKNSSSETILNYKLLLFDPHHLLIPSLFKNHNSLKIQSKIKYDKKKISCNICQSVFIKQK